MPRPATSQRGAADRVAGTFGERFDELLYRYRVEVLILIAGAAIVFVTVWTPWSWWTMVVWGTAVGLLVARPSRRALRGVLRRARQERRFEHRVAPHLGWKTAGRVPELLQWDETPERVLVRLEPLPEQGPRAWPDMADALRRYLHGATVDWRELHGVLTIVVALGSLPERLDWDPAASSSSRIVIGKRQGGRDLALDVTRSPHLLLAGATNAGKGATIRATVTGTLTVGWQAVVCEAKESGEFRWLEMLRVPVLRTLSGQVGALSEVEGIRQRRQAVVREHGVDHWLQLPQDLRPGWRFVLLVLDEAADMLTVDKAMGKDEQGLRRRLGMTLLGLVRKGRSAGVHVLVAIQRPDVAQLGEYGGSLRNNLVARLALGRLDADGMRMLEISASTPAAHSLDGTPGRGVCVGFGEDPRPAACQVAWLEQHLAFAHAKRLAAPQGLERLEPQARRLEAVSA